MKVNLKDRRLPWLIIAGLLIFNYLLIVAITFFVIPSWHIVVWLLYGVLLTLALLPIGLRLNVLNERYPQNQKLKAVSWIFIIPGAIVSALATIGWISDVGVALQSGTPLEPASIFAIILYIILDIFTIYVIFIRKNKRNK